MRVWIPAVLLLASSWLAGCTPTGPPATGANSSAPAAADQGTQELSVGGSNDFTPGHAVGAPTFANP